MAKALITLALVLSLLGCSFDAVAQPANGGGDGNTPQLIVPIIVAIVVIAVVGTLLWGLWKMCKKIPKVPPPDDPPDPPAPTNYPPSVASYQGPPMAMDTGADSSAGIGYFDLSARGGTYGALMATDVQGSSDGITWSADAHVLCWYNTNATDNVMTLGVYDASWQLVATRYGDVTKAPFDLGQVLPMLGPNRMYRLKVPTSFH